MKDAMRLQASDILAIYYSKVVVTASDVSEHLFNYVIE